MAEEVKTDAVKNAEVVDAQSKTESALASEGVKSTPQPTNATPSKTQEVTAPSRAAAKADQGTDKIVDLGQTTGKLWNDQQEEYAKLMEKTDPTVAQQRDFQELHDLQHEGSVLHDAEAKKAALMVTDKKADTPADVNQKSKDAVAAQEKIDALELKQREAAMVGNPMYDAEAKKAALMMTDEKGKAATKASEKKADDKR